MYSTHQPQCQDIALSSPLGTYKVALFALVSAHVKFYDMPQLLHEAYMGTENSHALFGFKFAGAEWLWRNREYLHKRLTWLASLEHGLDKDIQAMLTVMQCPGLNLIKAGFVCQMILGIVGCIDTQNQSIYGSRQAYASKRSRKIIHKVSAYVHECRRYGGAESLWNTWCERMFVIYPQWFPSADHISELHPKLLSQLGGDDDIPY